MVFLKCEGTFWNFSNCLSSLATKDEETSMAKHGALNSFCAFTLMTWLAGTLETKWRLRQPVSNISRLWFFPHKDFFVIFLVFVLKLSLAMPVDFSCPPWVLFFCLGVSWSIRRLHKKN